MKNLFPGPFHYHHYEAVPTREQESSNENFTPNDVKSMLSSNTVNLLGCFVNTALNETANKFIVYFTDPYSWCNVGISVSYFAVGVVSRITQVINASYLFTQTPVL